jgi:hypothetical protein
VTRSGNRNVLPTRYSRRSLLGRFGAAAGALAVTPTLSRPASAHAAGERADRFGRIFDLPPFAEATPQVTEALLELGRPGGILDARDPLERGAAALISDLRSSARNRDSRTPAGITFLGQFLDHDVTFDTTSRLGVPTRPEDSPNSRTPRLDLDSVYGGGPTVSPHLYEPSRGRIAFRIESGGLFEDLPRMQDGTAIIADPRNDENLLIAGLHAAFLLFHNNVLDDVLANDPSQPPDSVFAQTRRLVTWHYHWLVLHEFLPAVVGRPLVDALLARGPRFYRPRFGEAFMPVEFQGAAFRFGHSMVAPAFRVNLAGDGGRPFVAMLFDPSQEGQADPADLRGGVRAARRFVGWQGFFDFGDGEAARSKRIDTKLSTPLFDLPLPIVKGSPPTALSQRNLLRHLTWGLPSGQAIARAIDAAPLDRRDLSELRELDLERSTPLWFYVLKEAEVVEGGQRLGPVGARIVGEVFVGLLQSDPDSYLTSEPSWLPTLPTRSGDTGDFQTTDLLALAGVDPSSRAQ